MEILPHAAQRMKGKQIFIIPGFTEYIGTLLSFFFCPFFFLIYFFLGPVLAFRCILLSVGTCVLQTCHVKAINKRNWRNNNEPRNRGVSTPRVQPCAAAPGARATGSRPATLALLPLPFLLGKPKDFFKWPIKMGLLAPEAGFWGQAGWASKRLNRGMRISWIHTRCPILFTKSEQF